MGKTQVWGGVVTRVVDGDTVRVLRDEKEKDESIRIWGIDAPEMKQVFGEESKKALQKLLPVGSRVEVLDLGRGRFGRVLGILENERGESVQKKMLAGGNAWFYHKTRSFGKDEKRKRKSENLISEYKTLQRKAKMHERGLWGEMEAPKEPWVYRKEKREERSKQRIRHEYYKLGKRLVSTKQGEASMDMETGDDAAIEVGDLCQVLFDPSTNLPVSISNNCRTANYMTSRLASPLEMERYFSGRHTSYSLLAHDANPGCGIFEEHNALSKALREGKCPYDPEMKVECIVGETEEQEDSDEEIDDDIGDLMDAGSSDSPGEEEPEYLEIFIEAENTKEGDIFANSKVYHKEKVVQADIKTTQWNVGDQLVEKLENGVLRVERKIEVPMRKVYRPIEARAGRGARRGGRGGRGRIGGRRRAARGGSSFRRRGLQRRSRFPGGGFGVGFGRPARRRRGFRPIRRRRNIWFPPLFIPPVGVYGQDRDLWLYLNYPEHYVAGWRYDPIRGVWIRPGWASFNSGF